MKLPPVVILCGGLGLRMRLSPDAPPKALTPIGGMPVLWHVMRGYASWGFREFILALGHRGEEIVGWFEHRLMRGHDLTIDFASPDVRRYRRSSGSLPPSTADAPLDGLDEIERCWRVTFADTGELTMTGGRLRRVLPHIEGPRACVTYADGISDVPIPNILEHHAHIGADVTLCAVSQPTTFGVIEHADGRALSFAEKPRQECSINGGFFVVERHVIEAIDNDGTVFEEDVLPPLARAGRLGVYVHNGFWQCLDTPKEAHELDLMWRSGAAPWKRW